MKSTIVATAFIVCVSFSPREININWAILFSLFWLVSAMFDLSSYGKVKV